MNFSDMKEVEHEVDRLLNLIQPLEKSNIKRHQVSDFVRKIVTKQISNTVIVECGSSSLKSYLPESDLDLVLFTLKKQKLSPTQTEIFYLKHIFNSLCDEIISKEENRSLHYDMNIRNVEFINARIKITHCIVNNINVDITVQHISSIVTLLFLEEVDKLIGNNHLFKRSLLLIKDWCLHESVAYCGVSILGSKLGMLSSYSISVLVLYLFNKYDASVLTHPIIVLRYFLHTYMNFSWDLYILTISGPQLITHNGGGNDGQNFSAGVNKFQIVVDKLHYFLGGGDVNGWLKSQGVTTNDHSGVDKKTTTSDTATTMNKNSTIITKSNTVVISNGNVNNTFAYRCCNIQDPMDRVNNLAFSVTRTSLQSIELALREGHKKLVSLLQIMANHQILLQQQKLNQEQYNMNVVKNLSYNNNSNNNSNNGNNSNINNNSNSINGGINSNNKQSNIPGISQKNRRSHSMTDTTLYQNKLYRSPQQQTISAGPPGVENTSLNTGHTPTAALFAQQHHQPQYHSVPQYISDTKSVDSNSSNESYNSNFSVPSSINSLNSYNSSNISSAKNKTPNNANYNNNNIHNSISSNSSYSYVNSDPSNININSNINSQSNKNTNNSAVTNNNTTNGTTNSTTNGTHNIHINTNINSNNDSTISPEGSKATKSQKRKETQAQLIQMMKVDNNSSIHVNTTNNSTNSSTNNSTNNSISNKSGVVPTESTIKNGTSSKLSSAVCPTNMDTKSTTNNATSATSNVTTKTNKRNKTNKSPSPALVTVTDSENQPQSSTTVAVVPKESPAVEVLAVSESTTEPVAEPDVSSASEEIRAPVSAISSCSDDVEEGQWDQQQMQSSDTPQHIPQFSPHASPETVMSTDVISALTTLQNTPAGDADQDYAQEQQLHQPIEDDESEAVNANETVSVVLVDQTTDQQTLEHTSEHAVEQTSSLEDISVSRVESTEIAVDGVEVASSDSLEEGIAESEETLLQNASNNSNNNNVDLAVSSSGDSVTVCQSNINDTGSGNNNNNNGSSFESRNNGNLFKKAMNKINKQNRSDSAEDLRKSITKSTSKSNLVGELLKSITKGTAPNETQPKVNLATVNAFVNALNAEMSPAATSKSHSIDTQSSKNSAKHDQTSAISATNVSVSHQETVTPAQEPEETPQYSPEITETPVILSHTSSSNNLLSPHNNSSNNINSSSSSNGNNSPMANNNNSGGKINKRNIKSPPLLLPVNISTIPTRNNNSNGNSSSNNASTEKPSPRVKPQTASLVESQTTHAHSPRNAAPPPGLNNTASQEMQPKQQQQQQQYGFHQQGLQSGDVRSHSALPPPPLVQQSPASQRYLYDQQQTAQSFQQQPQGMNNLVPGMQVQIPQYNQQQQQQQQPTMPVFDANGNFLYFVPPGEFFNINSNITDNVSGSVVGNYMAGPALQLPNVNVSPALMQQQQQYQQQLQKKQYQQQQQQQPQLQQQASYYAGQQGVPLQHFVQNDPQNAPPPYAPPMSHHMQHHTQYSGQQPQYPQIPFLSQNVPQNVPILVPFVDPQQQHILQQQQNNNIVVYNTSGPVPGAFENNVNSSNNNRVPTAPNNSSNSNSNSSSKSPMNQQTLARNQMQYQQIHNNEQHNESPLQQQLQKKQSFIKFDHGAFASQPHTPTAAELQLHVKQQYDQQHSGSGVNSIHNNTNNSSNNNINFNSNNFNGNNNVTRSFFPDSSNDINVSGGGVALNNSTNNPVKMSSNSSVGSNHSAQSVHSVHHNPQHSTPVSSVSTGFTSLPPTTVLQSLQRGPSPAVSNGKHIQPNMAAGHQNNTVGNNHGNSNNSHNSNGGQHNKGNNINNNNTNSNSNSGNNSISNSSNITLNSIGGTIGPVENFFIQHFFPLTIKNYLLINILNTPSSDSNTDSSGVSSKAEISVNNMYSDTTVIRSDLMDHPLQFINMVNNAQAAIVQQQQQQSLLLNGGKGLGNSNINSSGGNNNSNASSVRSTPVMSGKHKNFTQSPQLTANFNTTTHYPNNTPSNYNTNINNNGINSSNGKVVHSSTVSDVNRPLTPERDVLFSDTYVLWDALQKIVAAENACCSDDESESDTAQIAGFETATVSKSANTASQTPTAVTTAKISVVTPIEINSTSTTESNAAAATSTLSPTKRFLSIFARTSSNSGHSTPVSKSVEGNKILSASNNTTEVDSGISSSSSNSSSSNSSGIIAAAASALNTLTSIATTTTTTTNSATPTTTTENTVTPIKDATQRVAPNSGNSIGSNSTQNNNQNSTQNSNQNSNSHSKQKPGKGNKQRMSGNKSSAGSVPTAPTTSSTSNNRNRNNSSGSAINSSSNNSSDNGSTNIDIPKLTFAETYIITITDCYQFICVKYHTICTTIRVTISSYSKLVLKFMKVYKLDKMWVKILSFLNKYRALYDNNMLLVQFIATVALSIVLTLAFVYCYRVALQQFYVQLIAGTIHLSYPIGTQWNFFKFSNSSGYLHPNNCTGGTYMNGYCTIFSNHTELMLHNDDFSVLNTNHSIATHWVRVGDSISFGTDISQISSRTKIPNILAIAANANDENTHDNNDNNGNNSGNNNNNSVFKAGSILSTIEYFWTKDTKNITLPAGQKHLSYYTIQKSTFMDSGHYRCFMTLWMDRPAVGGVVTSTGRRVQMTYLVTETIVHISKEPKVRNKPSYQEVKQGTNFLLELHVTEGSPPPQYQWYKNGYAELGRHNQSIYFHHINISDSGTYSCDVYNIAGGFVWLEATIAVVP